MRVKFFHKRALGKIIFNLMLVLTLILSTSTTTLAGNDDVVLPEIRSLLQNQYVDPVSAEVLNAPTVEETLKRLGDPHTEYFSPVQYQDFQGSIDMRFYGIGIHIEMLPEGVKVISVISGSPAEEIGLQPGDVIIQAAGQSLVGLSSDQAVNILRGVEGSTVQITVRRGTVTKDYKITRRAITEPTVTGAFLDGHIGYLSLKSFGSNTPKEFQTAVLQLSNQKADSWIVDLRDNGGGYLNSAIDLAGYFIGPQVAVQVKDRTGVIHLYQAPGQPFTLNQPILFLTNENSASASEVLTAAVKDYRKATIVGTTTYGKGSVQSMFTLSNGGTFKMTVDHFFSPFGRQIDKVGVTPDVVIRKADSLKAAELLLSNQTVALTKARTPDYWEAWGEVLNRVAVNQTLDRSLLYYPNYRKLSELSNVPLDKKFTVHFDKVINWQSVDDTSVELIDSVTGERILTTFSTLGPSDVQVIPEKALSPETTYWLVIHPTIKDVAGQTLSEGTLEVVHTLQGSGAVEKAQIQSFGKPSNYGWAIWDLGGKQ